LLIISSNLSKNVTTFNILNFPQLERQGPDLETKIEELQIINQSLLDTYKVKEDALTHL
jgi:hypothetical protein